MTSGSASPDRAVGVIGFDHLVLRVADCDRALAFYCGELGLAPERVDEWRRGDAPFPSARVDATTVIDFLAIDSTASTDAGTVANSTGANSTGANSTGANSTGANSTGANLDHLCLVVAVTDLDALASSGRFTVVDGPALRWGAQGIATSVYVVDPDGNTVELRHY